MTDSDAIEVAAGAVDFALEAGADAAEAAYAIAERFHVEARDATISKLERSTGSSLQLRLWNGGRHTSFSTSDLRPAALREAVARAFEQSAYVAADPYAGLPDENGSFGGDLELFDPRIAQFEGAAKVDDALALERVIRAVDPRVVNSNGSHYSDATSTIALVNSRGFRGLYSGTRASRSTAPVAQADGTKRTAHYGTAGRFMRDLEPAERVGAIAARRAVEMFGARKPSTMRVPVIFERDVAAAVLDDIFAAVAASNVAVGNSWLADRIGERVGSELVTIIDDGTLPGRLGSAPFDGEGVATRRTPVFEAGILRTFLFDAYYARKLGARTTGNSTGGGIGPNNLYLEPGAKSLEELIAATPRGVLVLDTIGFAAEHASGAYSRGARGFMIENGELTYPIDEFTIAGNFAAMLAALDAVASDLRFDGATAAPSFRVAEMTVSGN
ncbi:MAG TPA: TldD/PmbA family protein [Candidatus Baltobacteraceae bacterium]|nr:TldD/PmbA family protein [Candidatus Baltobacteraceae bacterium]